MGIARRLELLLRRTEARRGFWGIEVARLSDGKILYSQNVDHLFQPASNAKLFTTAAAIEKLGPDYVFRTTAETEAAPDAEGRVGDLVVVGRGDPNLSGRVLPYQVKTQWSQPADAVFEKLAERVTARGVREVAGNVVADDTYFLFEPYGRDWAQDDLPWGYGAPVTALAFNDNVLFLRLRPGGVVGEPAQARLDPIPDYYKLIAQIETTGARTRKLLFADRPGNVGVLEVWGRLPLHASEEELEETVAIADPVQLAGELFRRALEARGVIVRGWVEARHLTRFESSGDPGRQQTPPAQERRAPSRATGMRRVVLAEHVSLPVREDIKVINKVSQNLHAEMLLRTLGRRLEQEGSAEAGLDVLREFCAQAGIDRAQMRLADGSGLSREDLVTPDALLKLLLYMGSSPRFDVFLDSLPVAGVDGSLRKRFSHTPVEGRIHAKTGSIEHVNSLSGYMDLPSGERLAFSIIGNSHPLGSNDGVRVVDQLALTLFQWFASR